ncbi:8-amino-7-oxononanoate synthase [Bradyrhizobium sp. SZCCHNS1054]|uniref:8-amino-7-oxononanoate synthase n=1 Tax=Bradyrhizobium sp. SZCCHNS1054 TaxID=3057301 RepID=UPI002915D4D7|nr:8-amino-7-oxononanoate synthase [Bradyrhizobium sp. SZCCHNS1054]
MRYHEFATQLGELKERGRFRQLRARAGIDFTSNDYLGLAESDELRRAATEAIARGVPVGAGGSRLLRGNHAEHEALEAEAACHFGAETALYFGAGYTANHAIFSTLPQRGDLVLYDALVHASVHEGLRHCRATHDAVLHNDTGAFDAKLTQWRKAGGRGRPWIAIESVYSMDGDSPDLAEFIAVADRHDATLVIDEAHATGALGPDGRGLAARLEGRDNVITLHTCGKALGTSGGFVLAPGIVRDFLVNRARPFIFATAPSPLIAAVTRAALALSRDQPDRRERLAQLVAHAARELKARCGLDASPSHILPIIIGPDARAVAVATALQAQGFDVRAIRPPTVPEGTARLRIALTARLSETMISELFDATADALRRLS